MGVIVMYIGKAAVSKLVEVGISKAMGIEVQGSPVGAWAEQLALAVFLGQSMVPEPTFEQKAERRFHELELEISGLRDDISDLKDEMADSPAAPKCAGDKRDGYEISCRPRQPQRFGLGQERQQRRAAKYNSRRQC